MSEPIQHTLLKDLKWKVINFQQALTLIKDNREDMAARLPQWGRNMALAASKKVNGESKLYWLQDPASYSQLSLDELFSEQWQVWSINLDIPK